MGYFVKWALWLVVMVEIAVATEFFLLLCAFWICMFVYIVVWEKDAGNNYLISCSPFSLKSKRHLPFLGDLNPNFLGFIFD